MQVQHIADTLRNADPVSAEFPWSAPKQVAPHMATALDTTWLKLAPLLRSLRVDRYGAIGALVGTLETCAVRNWGWRPSLIAFFDLDIYAYNVDRDTGAYAYSNVCSPKGAGFNGEFVYARCDSLRTGLIRALAPFDCILVDGQHSPDAVKKDMETAYHSLHNGGVMLVHDLELPDTHLGAAYHEWIESCGHHVHHAEVEKQYVVHGLGIVQKL